jgi:hypothetical protein
MNVSYTDYSYVFGILVLFISFLVFIGLLVGYVLAKKVRGRHMAIGSALYWTISFINLYFINLYYYRREGIYQIPTIYTLSSLIFWSMFLVPFLNLAYIIQKYMQGKQK